MRLIFCLMGFVIMILGCEKYDYKSGEKRLPWATETGRGVFGCYIGDSTYVNTYVAKRQDQITYNAETGYLFLSNTYRSFEFRLFVFEGVFGPGEYEFDYTGESFVLLAGFDRYGLMADGKNKLVVTKLDLEKKVVSGTFELDLINLENKKNKTIRDGRFDLKIKLLY